MAFNRQNAILVSLATINVLVSSGIGAPWIDYDSRRILQFTLILGILAFTTWAPKIGERQNFVSVIHSNRLWLGILAAGACSAITSNVPIYSLKEWAFSGVLVLSIYFLGILLVQRLEGVTGLQIAQLAMLVLLIMCCVIVFRIAFADMRGDRQHLYSAFQPFDHPRFANQIQTWLLPIAGMALFLVQTQKAFYWSFAGLVLAWIPVWISGGAGVVLGQCMAMAFIIGLNIKTRTRVAVFWVAAICIALIIACLLTNLIPFFGDQRFGSQDGGNTSTRLALWSKAINAFEANPFFGIGPGLFASIPDTPNAHPHNIFLQILSEWGLIAAAFAGVLLFRWFGSFIKQSKNQEFSLIEIGLVGSIIAAITHSLVSGIFVMPASQTIGMTVISLYLALNWRRSNNRDLYQTRSLVCVAYGMYALVLICSLYGRHQPGAYAYHKSQIRYEPRMWKDNESDLQRFMKER
jgi:putative inorganic carbon (HCO3(-)) transporter